MKLSRTPSAPAVAPSQSPQATAETSSSTPHAPAPPAGRGGLAALAPRQGGPINIDVERPSAVLDRLYADATAQLPALTSRLAQHGVDPKRSRVQLVVDTTGADTSGVLDATALALLVAEQAGLAVAVTATDGTPLGGFGADPQAVLARLQALAHGPAAGLDADTAAWLRETQTQRRLGTVSDVGELGALGAAHQSLRRNQRADEHDAILLLKSTPSNQGVNVLQASYRHEGIAMHGVAVGAGRTQLEGVTVKPDAKALRRAVGDVLAATLLTSLKDKLEEHVRELKEHRATTVEMLHETQRVVADAWFATSTQEFVHHASSVEERLVRSYRQDPLVFDLSGKGMSGLELVNLKAGDGLLLGRTEEVQVTRRDLGLREERRVTRQRGNFVMEEEVSEFARTGVHTTTVVRETRFSQWVGHNTGVLVMDRGNGFDRTSLFGDMATTGRDAADGFADLARLDKNGDGIIDANDPAYHQLRIWRDRSGKGQVDPADVMTLSEAGIAEIRVASTATGDEVFAQQGTWVSQRGVELREQVQQAPAQLQRASKVNLVLRDTAGTSFSVVGGYLAGPAELDAEIAKQQGALEAVLAELRQLQT